MEIAAESGLGTTLLGNLMVANRPLATPESLPFQFRGCSYEECGALQGACSGESVACAEVGFERGVK
jgi:hypothetical protein